MEKEAQLDRDSGALPGDDREKRSGGSLGNDLEKKYPVALVMYALLAIAAWFTVGEGNVTIAGRHVEVRLIPILILALFAFRTYVAMQADRIRREKD
jgi:hypothetical protein